MDHSSHIKALFSPEVLGGVAHGAAQGSIVFLVGLALFAALVWLPASRAAGAGRDAVESFGRWAWTLFGVLVVAGAVEVSLYAVRASGEAFGTGLFMEALFETRVGDIWLMRLGLGFLAALAITAAVRLRRRALWLGAAAIGSVLLLTLTQLSHAAAEGRFLPFFSDWLHVIAGSFWMGGLLGFPLILFGPLLALPEDQRTKLRREAVRRFSRIALVSVTLLAVTGLYAVLLHIPNLLALLDTPYGIALSAKLFLLALLIAAGAANFLLEGRGPFENLVSAELALAVCVFIATGFLTSLPPP